MSDPDTGEFEGLAPQEALDSDERLDNDDDSVDPPDRWHGADQYGTTPAEEAAGKPLDLRLAEERPDQEPPEVPERPVAVTPIDELDESVDEVSYAEPDDAAPSFEEEVREADAREDEEGREQPFAGIDEVGGLHLVSDSDTGSGALT